ncbi:MAG: AtpZ/AtpI family protein [Candidatus Acidoferrales bacterium]|nr:AtpZ/AtpI family protein [Candidatus Acidoferrales bacterium]
MPSQDPGSSKTPGAYARQFALAMELPFLLVGGVVVGGFVGHLLDHWWHTQPYLMIVLGALGFGVGVKDMLRRLAKDDASSTPNHR